MRCFVFIWLLCALALRAEDFSRIQPLLTEHCVDCHAASEPDGKLVLESYADLLKGGESGAAIVPGKPEESLLVKMIEGTIEKDGKKIVMPPGKRKKLSAGEIELIKEWIKAGALEGEKLASKEIEAPKIEPKTKPKRGVNALAYAEQGRWLGAARTGGLELWNAEEQVLVRELEKAGIWNAICFSSDGKFLFAGGGESGLQGEVRQYETATATLVRSYGGHRDAIYGLALSPDGKTLATGSYDQKIKLWNTETGEELRTLSGHNGCVYGLDFRPDGRILASASGDRTVKLWDVSTGERRDTLSQSLKELYTVKFSPDGKRVAAAGVDNRVRVWEVSDEAKETTNPILVSKFAHEGPILRIAFSNDGKLLASASEDRTVKLWEGAELKEKLVLEKQPDWVPALTFVLGNKGLAVGRADESIAFYDANSGSALPRPKPELAKLDPRGIQSGVTAELLLTGKFLGSVTEVIVSEKRIQAELVPEGRTGNALKVKLASEQSVPRGAYTLKLKGELGETAALTFHLDDLPQLVFASNSAPYSLPTAVWGTFLRSGQLDRLRFEGTRGQTIVIGADARSLGSKAGAVITLKHEQGTVLASSNGAEWGGDPLLAFKLPADGTYEVEVNEMLLGASADHFYRLTIGELPMVTAIHPMTVPANGEREVELVGWNLEQRKAKVLAKGAGEIDVPIDPAYRTLKPMKVTVAEGSVYLEAEPNNSVMEGQIMPFPGKVAARSDHPGDEDWFQVPGQAGQEWIIETRAARAGSPADTLIEVRDAEGRELPRVLLQAVRDSAITFRGIDSNTVDCRVDNWEEMELTQYLYLQGEVVRLFRMPQGPDSGFNFYAVNGKRRNYFDTSATAHPNEEPCYIVEPHRPGEKLAQNGLPVFPIFHVNDDDADRELGADSRLHFTVPKDGAYYVRVRDTRGFGGERFVYELTVRLAQPGFNISVNGMNPTIARGSGQSFSVTADRVDGFEGEIELQMHGIPEGITISNPLVIQEGHTTASGTIHLSEQLKALDEKQAAGIKITAKARIRGETVTREAGGLGTIKVADNAPLYVTMENIGGGAAEITIAPGATVPALLKVRRAGHEELMTFAVENLPHGIIVDNIGLNGVLIPKDQNEREIFLTAQRWVPETDRWCYAICNEAGRQTSLPVLIKVRKGSAKQVAGR